MLIVSYRIISYISDSKLSALSPTYLILFAAERLFHGCASRFEGSFQVSVSARVSRISTSA